MPILAYMSFPFNDSDLVFSLKIEITCPVHRQLSAHQKGPVGERV